MNYTDQDTSRRAAIRDSDIKAIQELRARDAAAARAGDFKTLRSLISDEAVILPPSGKPQVGKAEIDAAFARMSQAPRTYEVLEYVLDLSQPEIVGNYAFEHGAIRGSTRDLDDGTVQGADYHVMRILRKEADGEWRVYRSIWAPGR